MDAPARPRLRWLRSPVVRAALGLVALLALGIALARVELEQDLSSLDVGMLSGAPEGNYHRIVDGLSDDAARGHGQIRNLASEGSVDNLHRLTAAAQTCEAT